MQKSPQSARKGVKGVEDQHDSVLDALVVAWQFVEGPYEHLVEGIEDVLVDEVVVGKVNDC